MVTLLSTLGFTPDKLLPAVIQGGGVDKLIIYHAPGETSAKEEKAQQALARVVAALRESRLAIHPRKLPHPWRVPDMLRAMLDDLRREGPENCIFNLTGGTKAMAVAATLACVVTNARALYVPEESSNPKPIALPLPPMPFRSLLTRASARMLRKLAEHAYGSQAELARALRWQPSTALHYLRVLAKLQAVKMAKVEGTRGNAVAITDTGRLVLLLHETLEASSDRQDPSADGVTCRCA